jgi:hypothetical protein
MFVLYAVSIDQANKDDATMFKSIMGDGGADGNDNDNSSGRPAVLLALVDDAVSGCIIVTGTHGSGKREVLGFYCILPYNVIAIAIYLLLL